MAQIIDTYKHMTLFVQLRILKISVDEKMQICHTIPKLQRKKKNHQSCHCSWGCFTVQKLLIWLHFNITYCKKEGREKRTQFSFVDMNITFYIFFVYLKLPVLRGFQMNKKCRIRCEINKSLRSFHRFFSIKDVKYHAIPQLHCK